MNCTRCKTWTDRPDAHGLCLGCHDSSNARYVVTGDYLGKPLVWQIEHGFVSWQEAVKALEERAQRAEARVRVLDAECAQMSEELGLPPTIRPAEGELRRMKQSLERVGAAVRHCQAVRDGVVEPLMALRRIENVLTVPHVHPSHMPSFDPENDDVSNGPSSDCEDCHGTGVVSASDPEYDEECANCGMVADHTRACAVRPLTGAELAAKHGFKPHGRAVMVGGLAMGNEQPNNRIAYLCVQCQAVIPENAPCAHCHDRDRLASSPSEGKSDG